MELHKKHKHKIQRGRDILDIIMGIVMIVLGIMVINRSNIMWMGIYVTSLLTVGYLFLKNVYNGFIHRKLFHLLRSLGLFILGVIIAQNYRLVIGVITSTMGIWALFNAGVHGLELYLKIKTRNKGKLIKCLLMFFEFVIGFLLLTQGQSNKLIINIQIGGYIIVYAGIQIYSSVKSLFGDKVRWSLSAPVLFAALTPPVLVSNLGKLKQLHPEDFNQVHTKTTGNNISIYIHVKNFGFERFGHLDLGYNGSIYSYGNYCEKGRSKHAVYGDGILICGSEVDIIDYSVHQKNIVYQYIISLSDAEALSIEKGMERLMSDTYYYKNEDPEGAYLSDLESRSLFYSFYKFFSEPYKTYNLFTTNCVMLAAEILDSSDHRLFNLSGIITPGTYFSYLEEMVQNQKIAVVRNIHTLDKTK